MEQATCEIILCGATPGTTVSAPNCITHFSATRTRTDWAWELPVPSDLGEFFTISGADGSIATKVDQQGSNFRNCLVTAPPFAENTGKQTISFTVLNGIGLLACPLETGASPLGVFLGVVWDAHCDGTSWLMHAIDGSLYGSGKEDDDASGAVQVGQVLTMQADTDAGSLKFWLDGKPHGAGYSCAVKGCLRWAICVENKG